MIELIAEPLLASTANLAQLDPNQLDPGQVSEQVGQVTRQLNSATEHMGPGLSAETLATGNALAQQVATSEWLGPLAPIALSPFFGLAALSGAATYGPEWLQQRSALFGEASPLNNPVLFWSMVGLAVLTSLPRFTKVSKPIALVADNLEAYSAIIILIVVRFVGASSTGEVVPQDAGIETAVQGGVLVAGVGSLSLDIVMSLIAALNVIVINVVKLFFEFLVWLIPFPSVDAILEAANKSMSAAMMGLYMYSPTLATILNLVVLGICLLVFGWCYRRLQYYREVVAGPLLAWMLPNWFRQTGRSFRAFSGDCFDGLPAFAPLTVTDLEDGCLEVRGRWLWKSARETLKNCQVSTKSGIVIQHLNVKSDNGDYSFKHRRWVSPDDNYAPDLESSVPSPWLAKLTS